MSGRDNEEATSGAANGLRLRYPTTDGWRVCKSHAWADHVAEATPLGGGLVPDRYRLWTAQRDTATRGQVRKRQILLAERHGKSELRRAE